jgi:hypothetical protein
LGVTGKSGRSGKHRHKREDQSETHLAPPTSNEKRKVHVTARSVAIAKHFPRCLKET